MKSFQSIDSCIALLLNVSHTQILRHYFLSPITFKSSKINNSRYRSLIQEGCMCTRRENTISARRECESMKINISRPCLRARKNFLFLSCSGTRWHDLGRAGAGRGGVSRSHVMKDCNFSLPLRSSPWPRFLSNLVTVAIDKDVFNFSAHYVLLTLIFPFFRSSITTLKNYFRRIHETFFSP